jgi:hypothetical protein
MIMLVPRRTVTCRQVITEHCGKLPRELWVPMLVAPDLFEALHFDPRIPIATD